ncbi:MAG: hypothetical protein BM557_11500 [Flavobacterium sp. MedPE-SWcel]|uniref:hypothetical protein n=1 Tax=uncultured Flavobacterium sp. TaxID=165435 RepID=UPI00091B97C0|nr:hypothetical protein [uncultured Flavobacterium sp.]OIQ15386.1 MAG: hypothetical protein BM557_11500 [Flavobacterium sp. MedPE-SWcel]
MKNIYLLLLFGAAFWAFYEQSKAEPNKFIMIGAIAIFMIGLMRLMSKVPSKGSEDNKENEEDGV